MKAAAHRGRGPIIQTLQNEFTTTYGTCSKNSIEHDNSLNITLVLRDFVVPLGDGEKIQVMETKSPGEYQIGSQISDPIF